MKFDQERMDEEEEEESKGEDMNDEYPGEITMSKQDSQNPGAIINSTLILENERGISN